MASYRSCKGPAGPPSFSFSKVPQGAFSPTPQLPLGNSASSFRPQLPGEAPPGLSSPQADYIAPPHSPNSAHFIFTRILCSSNFTCFHVIFLVNIVTLPHAYGSLENALPTPYFRDYKDREEPQLLPLEIYLGVCISWRAWLLGATVHD